MLDITRDKPVKVCVRVVVPVRDHPKVSSPKQFLVYEVEFWLELWFFYTLYVYQ